MIIDARPPFEVIKVLDTGPITNHVNFARNSRGQFAYVTVGGLNLVKRLSYLTRLRLTGCLGRRDSNLCIPESKFAKTLSLGRRDSKLCISKSDLLNFIPPQQVLGVDRARFIRDAQVRVPTPRAESLGKIPILICRVFESRRPNRPVPL